MKEFNQWPCRRLSYGHVVCACGLLLRVVVMFVERMFPACLFVFCLLAIVVGCYVFQSSVCVGVGMLLLC